MNTIIIEDEILASERLARMLKQVSGNIHIQAKLQSLKQAIAWLKKHQTELIFLDIQLSDGLSFEIFEQIPLSTPIIFTTAYNQYALRAFQHNSIDYLLKPIEKTALIRSITKYKNLKESYKPTVDYSDLLQAIQNPQKAYKQRFIVHAGQQIKAIPTQNIQYFYAHQKVVFLCTQQGQSYPIDYTLDRLVELLSPKEFFRINRKFLITFRSITKMFNLSRSRIKVELHPSSPLESIVSRDKYTKFKQWLEGEA